MKSNPAFPGPSNTGFQIGMTKLEYAAIHAPEEIPSWFKHKEPDEKFPPHPNDVVKLEHQTEKHLYNIRNWLHDGCYDLDPEYKYIEEAQTAHMEAKNAWSKENNIQRYFQWKIFFAETLLKTLTTYETIPQPVFDRREDKA